MARRYKKARTTTPNLGLEAEYRKKLDAFIDDMQRSIAWWIVAEYRKRLPEIEQDRNETGPVVKFIRKLLPAMDASPAKDLERTLNRHMNIWLRRMNRNASKLAKWFVRRANGEISSASLSALSDAVGFTVRGENSRMANDMLQSLIIENINLIKSIPSQYKTEITGLVMQSVREGRDIAFLQDELEKRYAITKRRARTIARDQNNKATETISRRRVLDAGVLEAEWVHTSASKVPRKSHLRANGKIFRLDKGCFIDGEWIYPGEKINCSCTFRPVLRQLGK